MIYVLISKIPNKVQSTSKKAFYQYNLDFEVYFPRLVV